MSDRDAMIFEDRMHTLNSLMASFNNRLFQAALNKKMTDEGIIQLTKTLDHMKETLIRIKESQK